MAYFCGPVKNCAPYLSRVLTNIEQLGRDVFADDYKIIIFYDQSTDGTLDILKTYQATHPDRIQFFVNKTPHFKYRTHNIAYARNQCLKLIRAEAKYPLFIMMDFDNVNASPIIDTNVLKQYMTAPLWDKWDALTFNTAPFYYDIWALSIYPYCYSYNHFNDGPHYYHIIKDYIGEKLGKLAPDTLLQCISAFNGFGVYKIDAFLGCWYDGRVNPRLIPEHMMNAHKRATHSPLMFPVYATADCRMEDCEHRAFHVNGFLSNGAKIRISPLCLFSNYDTPAT